MLVFHPMNRDVTRLCSRKYDVVVIGGGVCGAFAAREVALRGLSVALIERRDFGGGTSANSLKIIHGGLRYLQQADLPRVRESVAARRHLMRVAPHLVQPLPCVLPTERRLMRSRPVMALGLLANDVLSFDRNRRADAAHRIPSGRLLGRRELAGMIPGVEDSRYTGGALWYDGLAYNSERLVLGAVISAVEQGGEAANYMEVTKLLRCGSRVRGVAARDALTGATVEVQADLVINAAGARSSALLLLAERPLTPPPGSLAMGMNFVLRRRLLGECAFAAEAVSPGGGTRRVLFFVPWRNFTLAGTYYRPHEGAADELAVTDEDLIRFLGDLNRAWPGVDLTRSDVSFIHAGLLPARSAGRPGGEPDLLPHAALLDHERLDGVSGLLTLLCVKYTTACRLAARAAEFAVQSVGRGHSRAASGDLPLPGGDIPDLDRFLSEAAGSDREGVGADGVRHLGLNYGTKSHDVIGLGREADGLRPVCPDSPVLGAEVIHAVRHEMAQTLSDVVFRRTDLASTGIGSPEGLQACARLMARECKWDQPRLDREVALAQAAVFAGGEKTAF